VEYEIGLRKLLTREIEVLVLMFLKQAMGAATEMTREIIVSLKVSE
jgi:hypothetical protein